MNRVAGRKVSNRQMESRARNGLVGLIGIKTES